ncbi:MAG: hypothetical protein G8237_08580 [Magnetococcales bacterium]|nr:hypothetical protein [Magnetococcales bacterium]
MERNEDYYSAACRHLAAARLLEEHQRLLTADHLNGFAAECFLKHAMVQSGNSIPKKHIDQLRSDMASCIDAARFPDLLAVWSVCRASFAEWRASDRYIGTRELESALLRCEAGVALWERRRDCVRRMAELLGTAGEEDHVG